VRAVPRLAMYFCITKYLYFWTTNCKTEYSAPNDSHSSLSSICSECLHEWNSNLFVYQTPLTDIYSEHNMTILSRRRYNGVNRMHFERKMVYPIKCSNGNNFYSKVSFKCLHTHTHTHTYMHIANPAEYIK
jgi:hypothetical protein